MTIYRVGELYPSPSGKRHWPEGVDYNYRGGEHELRLFYRSPSAAEIADTKTGEARFAIAVEGDIVFFCYRFGGQPWGDCGFSIHLVPENERVLPPEQIGPEERALLNVILIDAENGVIRALRAVSLSPKFTAKLHAAIRAQAARPLPADYDAQAEAIYRRYDSAALAQQRAAVRCRGNE